MKTLLILAAVVISSLTSHAQDASATTLKNIQHIPVFKLVAAPDSIPFSSEQLKKDEPLILMFFNPDCDHCQKETKELLAYKQELKDTRIVMASALPYHLISEFYQEYNIASMPNITMGQDVNFVLGLKYHPTRYPAIYIYESKGNLAKVFAGNVGVPAILDALK